MTHNSGKQMGMMRKIAFYVRLLGLITFLAPLIAQGVAFTRPVAEAVTTGIEKPRQKFSSARGEEQSDPSHLIQKMTPSGNAVVRDTIVDGEYEVIPPDLKKAGEIGSVRILPDGGNIRVEEDNSRAKPVNLGGGTEADLVRLLSLFGLVSFVLLGVVVLLKLRSPAVGRLETVECAASPAS